MTKEEIENYFVESAGYGRDKVRNFMDIVDKALAQKSERITKLEKENARLKDGIALKDEEIGCVETDFNTFKSKAKEHIKKLLDCLRQDTNDPQTNYYVCQYMDKAEQFLNSEVEEV